MKTYLILTDETETSFRIDTTAWEREVDDTMIIDGTPMRIVAIYKREADRNEAWRILSAAIRRRNNRIRRRQAAEQNKAFASILMSAAKSAGIDEADAVSALRHLMS